MLEFNHEHVVADLSQIKSKTSKAKKAGKVMLAGVSLSAVMLLSGCGNSNAVTNEQPNVEQPSASEQPNVEQPVITSSAIIMENGNAMIVDLQSYQKYSEERGAKRYSTFAEDRTWILYTSNGDKLLVDFDSVKFIEGEDSHEKAETIAQVLIDENGRITCYDEVETFVKTR